MHENQSQSQGLAVIFSHHQVCIKKKGGHFLGGPKAQALVVSDKKKYTYI